MLAAVKKHRGKLIALAIVLVVIGLFWNQYYRQRSLVKEANLDFSTITGCTVRWGVPGWGEYTITDRSISVEELGDILSSVSVRRVDNRTSRDYFDIILVAEKVGSYYLRIGSDGRIMLGGSSGTGILQEDKNTAYPALMDHFKGAPTVEGPIVG